VGDVLPAMTDEFDLEKHIETYLLSLHSTLWGRTFDIRTGDLKLAREFIIDLLIDLEMIEHKEEG
jgi:hypothetical protein